MMRQKLILRDALLLTSIFSAIFNERMGRFSFLLGGSPNSWVHEAYLVIGAETTHGWIEPVVCWVSSYKPLFAIPV